MPKDPLRTILGVMGLPSLASASALEDWRKAREALLAELGHGADADAAEAALLKSLAWTRWLSLLQATSRARWYATLSSAGALRHVGPVGFERLAFQVDTPLDLVLHIARREHVLSVQSRLSDAAWLNELVLDSEAAVAVIDALRDPTSETARRLAELCPPLAALACTADPWAALEHEAPPNETPSHALLDHLTRVLARKLVGLERNDIERFQRDDALTEARFQEEAARLASLTSAGLQPAIRAALLFLDFAKGGTPDVRQAWQTTLGVELTVHNLAACEILRRSVPHGAAAPGVLRGFEPLASPVIEALVLAIVESHGLAGQAVRGETPPVAFGRWLAAVKSLLPALSEHLGVAEEIALALAHDALHTVNVCDTAGVREGLLTDDLLAELRRIRDWLMQIARATPASLDLPAAEAALKLAEEQLWSARDPTSTPIMTATARVADRLGRMRAGRRKRGEPVSICVDAVSALDETTLLWVDQTLRSCQLWYAEAATSALSADAQLRVLALALASAEAEPSVDTSRPYHVSMQPLLSALAVSDGDRAADYRARLVEAMLTKRTAAAWVAGSGFRDADIPAPAPSALGTFVMRIGGGSAVAVGFEESAEASALLTLLPIYERKSSAAFHGTLKTLCDLYGLRKDEFDRLANEALYLEHMNAARGDKARMLDHARPGRIVEIGPGGGVVLDLCEARFPDSEVIGIDVSQMVVDALREKKRREQRRWRVIAGDAFELPAALGGEAVDTVICCSLLHEIYSYVEVEDPNGGLGKRFQLSSVRDLLRACFRVLRPGGRLIIRDGVAPPPAVRILELIDPDARPFFDLFVEQFEGRKIAFDELSDQRLRLSAADAMEFLYTYTWGAQSFPYEVREQYGVLPYDDYRDHIVQWLTDDPWRAQWVALPPAERSYLQRGYREGLAGRVALYDESGQPVDLPDSNCLLIFEKVAVGADD